MKHRLMNYRSQLSNNVKEKKSSDMVSWSLIGTSGCYAKELHMEKSIRFLTCASNIYKKYIFGKFNGMRNYLRQFGKYVKMSESRIDF